MRQGLETADQEDARAQLAPAVYIHRLRAAVAGMAGDATPSVFTGGVRENPAGRGSKPALSWASSSVTVDPCRNADKVPTDRDIAADARATRVLVVDAREDREIARGVCRLTETRFGTRTWVWRCGSPASEVR